MRRNWIKLLVSGFLWLNCPTAGAQVNSLLQQADWLLNCKAYGRAIGAYTELLTGSDNQLTTTQKATVQRQRAYAYQQVGDGFGTDTNRIRRLPKKAKPNVLSADLRMLSVGDVVTIDNIYYDFNRFSLRPDAARELEKLVATMRKYPSLIIEIRSHTDSRGSGEQNKLLSARRAKAVVNLLTAKGISRRRITTSSLGESQLVNNCTDGVICTDAEHQRNRRTEFRVVAIK